MSRATERDLLAAARTASAIIDAFYIWIDRVNAAGGASSISGVAVCHVMISAMNTERARVTRLVVQPLDAAIEKMDQP